MSRVRRIESQRLAGRALRSARVLAAVVALVAAPSLGCSAVLASPADQAAYRAVRLSPTLEARVLSAQRYLDRHPEGSYRPRVEAYFRRAEPVYYALSRRDEAGLARYLGVLPEGPHAAEARAELVALVRRRQRGDSLSSAARETEARLARAALGRKRAREAFARWVKLLVEPSTYGAPLAEGREELVRAFALELPQAECTVHDEPIGDVVRSCDKRLELPFELRTPDGSIAPRVLELRVRIAQDAHGRPRHATVSAEELFVRLDEAELLRPFDGTLPEVRRAAAERAAAIVRSLVAGWAEGSERCERPVSAGEAYRASCGGLDVVVLSRDDGLDVVEITPSSPLRSE
jgi:hypothetical protein